MTCSVEHGLELVLADGRRASRSTYQTTLDSAVTAQIVTLAHSPLIWVTVLLI
jgi:hypothetical protein